MKPLIVIPARGGSKGVPGKNIKPLGGKPLIQYTIEAAQALFDPNLICVSTDDSKIKSTVEDLGQPVPFLRPEYLATDTAGTYEVLLHALDFYADEKNYEADTLILLQPTSPFRTAQHLEEALSLYTEGLDLLVSVKETKANPYYLLFEEDAEGFLVKSKEANFTRRQDCPKVWELNGAIYIINVDALRKKPLHLLENRKKFLMDEVSSHDIDTMLDWIIALQLLKLNELSK